MSRLNMFKKPKTIGGRMFHTPLWNNQLRFQNWESDDADDRQQPLQLKNLLPGTVQMFCATESWPSSWRDCPAFFHLLEIPLTRARLIRYMLGNCTLWFWISSKPDVWCVSLPTSRRRRHGVIITLISLPLSKGFFLFYVGHNVYAAAASPLFGFSVVFSLSFPFFFFDLYAHLHHHKSGYGQRERDMHWMHCLPCKSIIPVGWVETNTNIISAAAEYCAAGPFVVY